MIKTVYAFFALSVASALAGEMQKPNRLDEPITTTATYVCVGQDEHCIYVNGDWSAYSVTIKGASANTLDCQHHIPIPNQPEILTGPCMTSTAKGPITINVECRDMGYAASFIRRNVDITFHDDSHAEFTTYPDIQNDQIWAGFQGSPEHTLLTGKHSYQYPHISARVNCFSDNFDGK